MNKKPVKDAKNNTAEKKEPKEFTRPFEEYYNVLAHQMAPANHEFKKRLAIQMTEWGKTLTRPYIIEDFYNIVGISKPTVNKWRKECPELEAAYRYTCSMLASIRILGATEKNYDVNMVRFVLPLYWDEAEKLEDKLVERRAKASADAAGNAPGTVTLKLVHDSANIEIKP